MSQQCCVDVLLITSILIGAKRSRGCGMTQKTF